MRIGELAQRSNVSVHTIRYYEKRGLLDGTVLARDENNYRQYDETAVDRINLIKTGQLVGFSLNEIQTLLGLWLAEALSIEEHIQAYEQKIREFDMRIQEMQAMRAYLYEKITLLKVQNNEEVCRSGFLPTSDQSS